MKRSHNVSISNTDNEVIDILLSMNRPATLTVKPRIYKNALETVLKIYPHIKSKRFCRMVKCKHDLDSEYTSQQEPMAAGANGQIYNVCKKTDSECPNCILDENDKCKYVMKVIALDESLTERSFYLETIIASRAGVKGYGPEVFSVEYPNNDEVGKVVVKQWSSSLESYPIPNILMLQNIFDITDKMHDDGIWHQDYYGKNMLVDKVSNKVVANDFGLSIPFEKVPTILKAIDFVGLIYGRKHNNKWVSNLELQTETQRKFIQVELKMRFTEEQLNQAIQAKVNPIGTFSDPYKTSSGVTNCLDAYMTVFSSLNMYLVDLIGSEEFYNVYIYPWTSIGSCEHTVKQIYDMKF